MKRILGTQEPDPPSRTATNTCESAASPLLSQILITDQTKASANRFREPLAVDASAARYGSESRGR